MRAGIVGLGVEGKKAFKSLIENGWDIYASDSSTDIDLEELEISIADATIYTDQDKISIKTDKISIDLGYIDKDLIKSCDAILLSPSLWNTKIASEIQKTGKFICDVLKKHKEIFTIGITGTNGKTTSSIMLKEILENADKKVLIGGNAGGGFQGYCEILLKAEKENFDFIIVEVCDMTLDFCKYCFNFDLLGLTNIGNDHINVHGTINNYKRSLVNFFEKKDIIIYENEKSIEEFKKVAKQLICFSNFKDEISMVGEFNRLNAGLAKSIAKYLNIDEKIINDTLKSFEAIEGRLKKFKLNNSDIYVGKTDNSDAIKSIINEKRFYAVFTGTPQASQKHRFDILNEISKTKPEVIVLFPGLEDTIDLAIERLEEINYTGKIEIANDIDEIIGFIAEYSHEEAILIGGNGQDIIIDIQNRLELLAKSCC
ncbi:MAG: UDP-N-acetylmuramoylalanine--D-glutamate ligase [Methanobacteriaceae archaeon]|jgi:UDP-N-acetylmuramoylalanine--D-glutamate ligase|nr:UDP-N-acetylmuramoylalanine--D-glutamate ligase [Candidatus Methanorudis spinitermitis]